MNWCTSSWPWGLQKPLAARVSWDSHKFFITKLLRGLSKYPGSCVCLQDFIALVLLTIWTTDLYDLTQAGGTDADAVLSCADTYISYPSGEWLCVPLHKPPCAVLRVDRVLCWLISVHFKGALERLHGCPV